ncbi:MAG TPA: prepilin-type N-terminal cleavage/methylation domain-containing protein [Thermoanaerobaculia bacterium]|jgi:prepilin-type N-terminal cleavage/methylation domain-containing protein|nr:prepilin-type N-terminal cleavage/methylation domain-containing protein [Thermoanaerobaculia bacterium]
MVYEASPACRGRMRGFSLAEVLVAVAIMAVIILALFGLVTGGVRQVYGGKKMTEAATITESAMQRANINQPQVLLDGVNTDTSKTITWSKAASGTVSTDVTPAAETGTTVPITTRNSWRTLLVNSELPASAAHPAKLTVTMSAQPPGKNFGNASMVQIIVETEWWEWGTRQRRVRLQTLNLRVVPS